MVGKDGYGFVPSGSPRLCTRRQVSAHTRHGLRTALPWEAAGIFLSGGCLNRQLPRWGGETLTCYSGLLNGFAADTMRRVLVMSDLGNGPSMISS